MTMHKTLLISSALLSGIYSYSQDSTTSKSLDPVVITATKYPVKLSQTGKVVTVISPEQIDRSQGKNLAQILTEQSGMIVNGANSNPGKDKSVFLRGASNKYTLILLDGVPVNDPSGPGGAFDLRLFPVEQIDHIEILKGSQSTLYGSDALAGVINIITKKGGGKKIGINGGANYGSFNTFNGSAGVNGSTDNIDYNVNYTYSNTDGISEARDTTGKANFDKDGFMRNSFQANLSFKAGKNLKISPYYRYSYYKGSFDADAFTDGTNAYNALLNNTGAVATFSLPRGTVTANYGYTYARRLYISDFGTTPFKGRFHTAEAYLTQSLNNNVKLLAGFNYQGYGLRDTTLEKINPKTSIISPYVSFFIQNPTGLNVEVGGRYNHHSEFGGNFTYSFNTSYLINKQWKVFANISSGFKAPTVNDLFGPTFYGSNPDLKPEQSRNFEGGVQVNAVQDKLQLTATGYYRDITDLIAYVGTQLINIDEQKDKGAELEASFTPNEKWTIKAAYNFVTGNLYQARDGKDTSFYNLLRRPKNAVLATVGYQATKQLYVSVSAQSLGKRSDLFFAPPTYIGQQVDLAAYTLVNAYAEYKFLESKLKLFVEARNLTDADFTEVYGYSNAGINVTGGFRFNL
jgi:vitamin B12 transporter